MRTRFLGALLLALAALPACDTVKSLGTAVSVAANLSVPQKDVAAAVVAYDGAQDATTTYLRRPTCQAGQDALAFACKTKKGVALLAKDLPIGRKARSDLWQASLGATNGVGSRALLLAVITATTALTADVKN